MDAFIDDRKLSNPLIDVKCRWRILLGLLFLAAPAAQAQFTYTNATVYYLPATTGWSTTFAGLPTVMWNPQIQIEGPGFGVGAGQFAFNVIGATNITVVVEATPTLSPPAWSPLQTVTLTNGSYKFSEPLPANVTSRFYRLGLP